MGPDYFTDHLLGRIGQAGVQAELEAERKRLDDLKYIEKLAREDHNMVGKNEVPLFIVDEQEKQQKQETEAEEKKK